MRLNKIVALITLAVVLIGFSSRLDKVIKRKIEEVESSPTDPALYNDLGNLLVLAKRYKEAEEKYKTALEIDSNFVVARINLALLYLSLDRYKSILEILAPLKENNAYALFLEGIAFEKLGKNKKALDKYKKAFSKNPMLTVAEDNPLILDSNLVGRAIIEFEFTSQGISHLKYKDSSLLESLFEDKLETSISSSDTSKGRVVSQEKGSKKKGLSVKRVDFPPPRPKTHKSVQSKSLKKPPPPPPEFNLKETQQAPNVPPPPPPAFDKNDKKRKQIKQRIFGVPTPESNARWGGY